MELPEIKKFLDSATGMAMRDYLVIKLEELKNIDTISEKDTSANQTLELKAQKRAYKKLKEILQDIMTFSESIKVRDPRDSYGVSDEDIDG
jgi:hypothetical protein